MHHVALLLSVLVVMIINYSIVLELFASWGARKGGVQICGWRTGCVPSLSLFSGGN